MVGLRACPEATFKGMGILPLGFCDFRMVEIFGNLCHGVAEVDDLVTRASTVASGRSVSFKHLIRFRADFAVLRTATRLSPCRVHSIRSIAQRPVQFSRQCSRICFAHILFCRHSRTSLLKAAADTMYIKQIIIQGFKRYYPCAQNHWNFELILI